MFKIENYAQCYYDKYFKHVVIDLSLSVLSVLNKAIV